ncbi:DUF4350 domain-containing protein [Phosphitispora fastidiosa]|uniref:DUF4350 domain-containing protein n=1 Tax=Phosphitispora fastidiosa TaxID=2837202 RepID=UPI001E623ABC|nr:DUF4350 domain-containing protein [Phosphitispora fastidiosa]MBU7006828.1 hypothetical protein [Phosphitispora fastidiosa]
MCLTGGVVIRTGKTTFLAGLIIINILAALLLQRYFAGTPEYSTYNAGPRGLKALYLLTGELGLTNIRLEDSYRSLSDGVLMRVENRFGGLPAGLEIPSEPEGAVDTLMQWVREGGSLVLFTSWETDLTRALGIELGDSFGGAEVKPEETAFTADAGKLVFAGGRCLEPVKDAEVIARSPKGAVAVSFALGRGRVIVVSDPYPVTNKGISEGDNVIFVANILRVLQPSRVTFDESGGAAAGDAAAGGVARPVVSKTAAAAGVQAAAALLLLYIFWGRRFGRPVPLLRADTGPSAQYVNTMANIYRQGRAREIALESIYAGFWQSLTRALGVPGSIEKKEIINLCRQRREMDSDGLERLLGSVGKLRPGGGLSEAELFALVHDMENWRRENLKHAGYVRH